MNDKTPVYDEAIAVIKNAQKRKRGFILYIDEGRSTHIMIDGVTVSDLAELIMQIRKDHPDAFNLALRHSLLNEADNDLL